MTIARTFREELPETRPHRHLSAWNYSLVPHNDISGDRLCNWLPEESNGSEAFLSPSDVLAVAVPSHSTVPSAGGDAG